MLPPHDNDPFVDPAWRHLRAAHLVAEGKRADHRRDDAKSRVAWRFLRSLSCCTDEADREALARRMPANYEAHAFYTTAEPFKKAELEARLLARQDDDAIAERCGLTPAAVAAYHDFYYCVRHRLDAELDVLTRVLDAKIHTGLEESDRALILRLVGYSTGPLAVDSLLDFYARPPEFPADPERLGRDGLKAWCGKLRVQALLVSLTTAAHKIFKTAAVLEDLLKQMRTAEQGPAATSPALRIPKEIVGEWVRHGPISGTGTGQTEASKLSVGPAETPNDAPGGSEAGSATRTDAVVVSHAA